MHSHTHADGPLPKVRIAPLTRLVTAVLLVLAAGATVLGLIALWPDAAAVDRVTDRAQFAAPGVIYERAEVLSVVEGCADGTRHGDRSTVQPDCLEVGVGLRGGPDSGRLVSITVRGALTGSGLRVGDQVEVVGVPRATGTDAADVEATGTEATGADSTDGVSATYEVSRIYGISGIVRYAPLIVLALVFAGVVVAVGRIRGALALAALGVSAAILLFFVLPALVAGGPGLLIGVVGSSAIMFATLYFVHGPNLRTTAALVGTLCGILIMAGVSFVAVRATRLSGIGDEAAGILSSMASEIDFRGLLTCAIIIAGLGVLNDVTITQASAVWELRAAAPGMSRREIYARGMRIGRDHIASTVYTVFFAYVGAAMSVLILLYLYNRPMLSMLTTEDLVTEIVRTLCGSIGLVLAVPITTWLAALLLPPVEGEGRSAQPNAADHAAVDHGASVERAGVGATGE